ncbi:helix-turn-helix domain protein [mine drainage metagenome]|uniref:Helix-turn-helix domain protein n=1 Tax=mine drainage metagenome TaxID=410659 RepID=A0A1J5QYK3_9ZZZZ
MNIKESLGLALKKARIAKKVTQEDFSNISSRTYVSTLERGLYTPTVEKVDTLAKVIGVHPLTILSLAYLINEEATDASALLNVVNSELKELISLINNYKD